MNSVLECVIPVINRLQEILSKVRQVALDFDLDLPLVTEVDRQSMEESSISRALVVWKPREEICRQTLVATDKLPKILVPHIQAMMPSLRYQINKEIERRNVELLEYGDAPPPLESKIERGAMLLGLLSNYCQRFSAILDGRSGNAFTDLASGTRIRDIFQSHFVKYLNEMDWSNDLSPDVIRNTVCNSSGVFGSLLFPQEAFELLVKRSIKRLLDPAVKCKALVQNELLRIAVECCPPELSRFRNLQRSLSESVAEFIEAGSQVAEVMIRQLVDYEHDFINYDNPLFAGGLRGAHRDSNECSVGSNCVYSSQDSSATGPELASKLTQMLRWWSISGPKRKRSDDEITELKKPKVIGRSWLGTMTQGVQKSVKMAVGGENGLNTLLSSYSVREDEGRHLSAPSSMLSGIGRNYKFDPPSRDPCGEMEYGVEFVRNLVDNYMSIVRSNLSDMVPKAIMHHLVHHSSKGLQKHLIDTLYKEKLFGELMSEGEDVEIKRKNCQTALRQLHDVTCALNALPQYLSQKDT